MTKSLPIILYSIIQKCKFTIKVYIAIIIIPIILKLCQHNWEKPNKDQRSHIVGTIGKKASEFVFIQITEF